MRRMHQAARRAPDFGRPRPAPRPIRGQAATGGSCKSIVYSPGPVVRPLLPCPGVRPARAVLLVESDAGCGQALARLVRRSGDRVRLVRTPGAAVAAAQRGSYDLAVVDLFVKGGGVDLARRLTRRVPRVYLSVGAKLLTDEILEAAIGFPVLRKKNVPSLMA
jgi:hypothetical protein